ncbi:MAG: hypothetical protein JSR44_15630 [Spirochaetes bacterium]|nr:hypothetical protein [Spirochaetota bacterium]
MARAKKIAVLINPTSAGGRSLKTWPQFKAGLVAENYTIEECISSSETDFRRQARKVARDFDRVAVCGGDSSLTIAAEELLQARFKGELIFLPAGSVNDIQLDIAGQTTSPRSKLYLGHLAVESHEKNFIGQANWGLGVVVNRWVGATLRTLPFLRALQNFIGTLSIIIAHLTRREFVDATIIADTHKLSGRFSILLITQIRHWASGLLFAPQASYYSPEFEVIAIRRTGLITLIRTILAAKNGAHLVLPHVVRFSGKSISVRLKAPRAVQIDGDILRAQNREFVGIEFSLEKKASLFHINLSPSASR